MATVEDFVRASKAIADAYPTSAEVAAAWAELLRRSEVHLAFPRPRPTPKGYDRNEAMTAMWRHHA